MKKFAGAVEAALTLAMVKVLRTTIPLRKWSRLLGSPTGVDGINIEANSPTGAELEISLAIARAGYRVPGTFTCFDRAAAGQIMMRSRGLRGVMVIGLRSGERWDGHAWLLGETGVITGAGEGGAGLFPVSAFH
jgi:hypothetical protein